MKERNGYVFLSALSAVVFFFVVWLLLRWGILASGVLAVLFYGALTLILKPEKKIGNVKVSVLPGGEDLEKKLYEAREDLESIGASMEMIQDPELKESSRNLHRTAENIIRYLEENPRRISDARRFIDYYQDTASSLLKQYVRLQNTDLNTEDTMKLMAQTKQSLGTLDRAFEKQFERLMQNELFDMEADIKLLRQTMKAEGYEEKN